MVTCSKFLTTSDYAPRLRASLGVEQQLIDDATVRDGNARFSDTVRLIGVSSSSSAICSNSSQWPIRLGGHHYPGLGGNRPTAR